VKRKSKEGNMARKKLKEMEEALDPRDPSQSPLIKNLVTSYNGRPSKLGKTIFFESLTGPEMIRHERKFLNIRL